MKIVSEKTEKIEYSKIREMFNASLKLEDTVNFTIGEPDFTAPENVVKAANQAILEGKTKYSANAGLMFFREAISEYLIKEWELDYDPETEITTTAGAMCAIYEGLMTIINPGDEVIVNEPCWTNYIQQITMCGGVPVSVSCDLENGFSIQPDEIEKAITPKTKAVIINSPCNPTGTVLSADVLKKIAEIANKHDLLVISDEVYKHIMFDNCKHISIATFPGMRERTLVVDSFSKTFAMTGFRVGYAAGPREWIENITKLQENVNACVSMPSQYAATEALKGERAHLDMMVSEYNKRRDYISDRVSQMPLIEYKKGNGTFYAFINIKATGMTSEEFAMNLLNETGVVVVPGTAFGDYGEGFIRISFATSMENLIKGMDLLENYMRKVNATDGN